MLSLVLAISACAGGADFWAMRAEQFAAVGEWTAAIENADEAVRLDHENPQRYLDRAKIKLKAARFADALGDANRAELRFRRLGFQTMAPPYLIGEIYRLSADAVLGDVNEARVLMEVTERELNRIEKEWRTSSAAPPPGEPARTPEAERAAVQQRLATLKSTLQNVDSLRAQSQTLADKFTNHKVALEQAKESYSVAIGRLPPSPYPYAARKLADEALQETAESLTKAEATRDKADDLAASVAGALQALQAVESVQGAAPPEGPDKAL